MTLPEPVSAMATSVVGPFGLISGFGLSVALPDLPVVRLTHVTFSGSFCSGAGAGVPTAVNTKAVCPLAGPGFGMGAGPATEIAVARELPPSLRQPLPMDGYMNSWVGGLSGPKPGAGAAAGAGAGPGAGAGAGAGSGAALGAGAAAGAASGAGPTAWAGSTPSGRCASVPGMAPGAGTWSTGAGAPIPGRFTPAGSSWFRSPAPWAVGETNWLTDDATCLEASGAAELPANAEAAAISSDAALAGSAAAC